MKKMFFAFGLTALTAAAQAATATAVFAGGCFWCTESDFEKLPGVIAAESGYTGSKVVNPSYESVSAGATGHTEAVRVTYDPDKVTYTQLVEYFWRTIDPPEKTASFVMWATNIVLAFTGAQKPSESWLKPAKLRCSNRGSSKTFTPR